MPESENIFFQWMMFNGNTCYNIPIETPNPKLVVPAMFGRPNIPSNPIHNKKQCKYQKFGPIDAGS